LPQLFIDLPVKDKLFCLFGSDVLSVLSEFESTYSQCVAMERSLSVEPVGVSVDAAPQADKSTVKTIKSEKISFFIMMPVLGSNSTCGNSIFLVPFRGIEQPE
jgi:hypothetical protein